MKKHQMEALIQVLPVLTEILQVDVSIAVSDLSSMIAVQDGGKIKSMSHLGEKQEFNPFINHIIAEKKCFSEVTDRFNVPAKAIITPVLDDHGQQVCGLIFVLKEMEQQVQIERIASSVSTSFEQINTTVESIAGESQLLSTDVNETVKTVRELVLRLADITSIIDSIQTIASQSSLLALNAKIEAARAGDAGRGFGVVATEVSKLSVMSKESAERVKKSLLEMKKEIELVNQRMQHIDHVSLNQAAATEEISATVSNVFENMQALATLSKVL
mgnify:CR=1 FL=1